MRRGKEVVNKVPGRQRRLESEYDVRSHLCGPMEVENPMRLRNRDRQPAHIVMVIRMLELARCGQRMRLEMPMNDFRAMPMPVTCRMNVLGRQDEQSEHTQTGKNRDHASAEAS